MTRVCVVGCGNMGGALIRGLARSGNYEITACDLDPDARAAVEEYCSHTTDDVGVAGDADVVVVAVKPDIVGAVLDELDLSADQTLVTIAAGVSTAFVAPRTDAAVVRVMPNLAAEWGDMAAAATGDVDDEVRAMLADLGEFVEIDEEQMDTATALNGSGPAFVFYLLKAMADASVADGLDPEAAETLAVQTFVGAAETVRRSDEDVEDLIEAVCSPNGTTVEGMAVLRDSDAAAAVGDAVIAAADRSRELAMDVDDE
jgi:pyrroline-5-carboxylate reductase